MKRNPPSKSYLRACSLLIILLFTTGLVNSQVKYKTNFFHEGTGSKFKNGSNKMYYSAKYPVITGPDEVISNFINQSLGREICILFNDMLGEDYALEKYCCSPPLCAKVISHAYITSFGFPEEFSGHNVDVTVKILYNQKRYLSFSAEANAYLGGAHGTGELKYFVFDLEKLKILQLNDLVLDMQKLKEVGETEFWRSRKIGPPYAPKKEGFGFADDSFYLPDRWTLTPKGLIFTFTPYEISSYSDGYISFAIPYPKLKGIIKDEAIVN